MPNHLWGDDFDWNSLDKAVNYIAVNCRRWARMGLWTKEKWGTLRISTTCAYFDEYGFIHHIFYPGYARYCFPRWFRTYIDYPVSEFLGKIGIVRLAQKYQTFVLKYFWKRAAKKWPHISKEILAEYNWTIGEDD